MNRYLTLLGVICAALALIFQLVSFASAAEIILLAAAIILVGIGNLTGL